MDFYLEDIRYLLLLVLKNHYLVITKATPTYRVAGLPFY